MPEILNYEILAKQLNTKFVVTETPEPYELELIEISKPTESANQIYFSLFFQGDKKLLLPQGSYQMTHEHLGTVMLFIVPVAIRDDGYSYEAVFNFLKEVPPEANA